jgi:streptomycin 6-kinase
MPWAPSSPVDESARQRRRSWVASLPDLVGELADRWSLVVAEPFEPAGAHSWVAPAVGPAGEALVLKLARRHREALHEAEGLRVWGGDGCVRLHAAAERGDTAALLLERCVPGTALADRPEPEQDVVIAKLLERLWRTPVHGTGFRPLQLMCDEWADEFDRKFASGRSTLDPGLAREGTALLRALPATARREVLLCTDLHAGNVLAATREPWLVIDPKPYVGDPAYDPLQHLLNCDARLRSDPRGLARGMAGLLGLDPDRLLLWLFARCVQESPGRPALAEVARELAPGSPNR